MIKNIALILLLAVAVFSMIRYVSELKARYALQDSLAQAQDQISALAQTKQNLIQEKQNLLQELGKEKELKDQLVQKNKGLKAYLRSSKNRIVRLFHDNTVTKNNLEGVNIKFSILKAENRALIEERKRVYLENEQLKVKWNSLPELKKAIQELKTKERNTPDLLTEGNQGFLIKDGRPTALEKVKIEVVPAQTKE
ncbi:MAG: hypothetical protein Q7S42_05480 [Candidatus Omnitrophota bacterium]|nr:hypothetical protein [Candidatus Omnitrophota bacterium]